MMQRSVDVSLRKLNPSVGRSRLKEELEGGDVEKTEDRTSKQQEQLHQADRS